MKKSDTVCHCSTTCKDCGGQKLPSPNESIDIRGRLTPEDWKRFLASDAAKEAPPHVYSSGKRLYVKYNGVEHDVTHILKPQAAETLESLMPNTGRLTDQPLVIQTKWWPKSGFQEAGFEIGFTNGVRLRGKLEDISQR